MGIFNWFKRDERENEKRFLAQDETLEIPKPGFSNSETAKYIMALNDPLFRKIKTINVTSSNIKPWDDSIFINKVNQELPGFTCRSREKVQLCYFNDSCIIFGIKKDIIILRSNVGKILHLESLVDEKFDIINASSVGAVLKSQNNIAFVNFNNNTVNLFEFHWQPFSSALSNNFWLVGTRETYNGPGELYCLSNECQLLWSRRFLEEFQTGFGLIKATPYHLRVAGDTPDILVSTMDCLYRLGQDGDLISRITISDLRDADIKQKESQRLSQLSKKPQTQEETIHFIAAQMAEQFIQGIERAFTLHSPIAAFEQDPQTTQMYILEQQGRLSSWDTSGHLLWVHSFKEEGRYLKLIEKSVVVSFKSGHCFWINEQGSVLYSAKLPHEVMTISLIPHERKYFIVCKDGRRYELDQVTGNVTEGPKGDEMMRLFSYQGRVIFYDGYLWTSPIDHKWQTYETPKSDHATSVESSPSLETKVPQLMVDRPFERVWSTEDYSNEPIRLYAVDTKNMRIYIGRRKPDLSPQEKQKEEAHRSNSFAKWNEIKCLDFSFRQLWSKSYLSEFTALGISPEGDAVFIGLWGEGLAQDPAELVILNAQGKEYATFTTPANPLRFNFRDADSGFYTSGLFKDGELTNYVINRIKPGEWVIDSNPHLPEKTNEFGSGISQISVGKYSLQRTGKKSYTISYADKNYDLKVSAAIYEAITVPNSEHLLIRIGTRIIRIVTPNSEILWEIKSKSNVSFVVSSPNGFLLLAKEEISYVSLDGKIQWKIGTPTNSPTNSATWLKEHNAFLWRAGDKFHFQISLLSQEGGVIKSQIFNNVSNYEDIKISDDGNYFILPFLGKIPYHSIDLECYRITTR